MLITIILLFCAYFTVVGFIQFIKWTRDRADINRVYSSYCSVGSISPVPVVFTPLQKSVRAAIHKRCIWVPEKSLVVFLNRETSEWLGVDMFCEPHTGCEVILQGRDEKIHIARCTAASPGFPPVFDRSETLIEYELIGVIVAKIPMADLNNDL